MHQSNNPKWTFANFEINLKDLSPEVREKAILIGNDLINLENYTEKEAIEAAIIRAEEWFYNSEG